MAAKKKTSFDAYVSTQMADPEFAAAYRRRRLIHEVAIEVRRMREAAGMTQAELAKLVGTSQPTIARLERGQDTREPRWSVLDRIGMALGRQLSLVFAPTPAAGASEPKIVVVRGKAREKGVAHTR
jgi:DNA-binding XRE family transcriptional regulator